MYSCYRDSIAEDRSEAYPLWWVVAENLLYLGTWVIAGALLWPLRVATWPVATIVWAAVVVAIQVLGAYVVLNAASFPLRLKGCSRCAMRKGCPGSGVKPKGGEAEGR